MKLTWIKTKSKSILYIMVCLFLSGCGSFFPYESASPLSSTSRLVHSGAQATFDCDGQIITFTSTGNFEAEFIGQSGEIRNEMMSGLVILMRGNPEAERFIYAYSGLTYYYFQYKIQVLRVGVDRQNRFTEIEMSFPRQSESSGDYEYC
jgi:hypothetical protein